MRNPVLRRKITDSERGAGVLSAPSGWKGGTDMKTQWTEKQIDQVLASLREEPAGEAFWKDRVWKRIETALPAEALSLLVKPWYRRPMVLRLGLAAACLALALGWWRVQVNSTDSELADYVYNLATVDNVSPTDQLDNLASDAQCGLKPNVNDPDEPKLEMEAVYDQL